MISAWSPLVYLFDQNMTLSLKYITLKTGTTWTEVRVHVMIHLVSFRAAPVSDEAGRGRVVCEGLSPDTRAESEILLRFYGDWRVTEHWDVMWHNMEVCPSVGVK